MRVWHYIKSRNETLLVAIVAILAVIFLAVLFSKHQTQLPTTSVAKESVSDLCDNYSDIQTFENPLPITWTARFDGCLMSCYGASFTRVPSDEQYPRFAGYYPNKEGKYSLELDANGGEGGSQIPERFRKNNQMLKISGKWTDIDADHPFSVFEDKCVPIVNIEKIEILDKGIDSLVWSTYHNERFDYKISYPTSWLPKEESVNGDGRALYDDGRNKVSVYGKITDPQYPDDFIEGGKILSQKTLRFTNGEEGKLLYINAGNNVKYIMYIDRTEYVDQDAYDYRYIIYASVSDGFLDNNLSVLNRMMESFIPPPIL